MDYIKIEKINVNENIRKDYGDLTELTASIKEHGVTKPLEININSELIDGFRRLKAAKAAGLTEVPYFLGNTAVDKTTEQIISGIFSKNLNPVEEGNAFVKYMSENKIPVKEFAKKISKSEGYVQKRIEIVTLPKEITDEIISKRLEIGHALLLKKMPEPEAKKYAKEILREKLNVEEAKERAQYKSGNLREAKFNTEQCKGCKFNGSEQAELFETGKVLNGMCMNIGCYSKKMAEWVKALKEKYKDVLTDKIPNGYIRSDSYEAKEKGITEAYMKKCRETKENYAIRINENYGISFEEYFKPQKKETPVSGKKAETIKEEVREQKLEIRVNDFKTQFLIEKCKETISPGSKEAKALAMIEMDPSIEVKKAFSMTEKEIDKKIAESSISALRGMGMKNLIIATENNGVDIKKQFVITEEFLNLHTKDQLLQLINELGIKTDQEYNDVKKTDMVSYILSEEKRTNGKLPKILN